MRYAGTISSITAPQISHSQVPWWTGSRKPTVKMVEDRTWDPEQNRMFPSSLGQLFFPCMINQHWIYISSTYRKSINAMHSKLHNLLQNIQGTFSFFLRGRRCVLKTVKSWPILDRTAKFFRNVVLRHIVRIHRILLLFRVLNVYRDAAKALRIQRSIIYLHTINKKILYLYIKKLNVAIIKELFWQEVCLIDAFFLFLKYLFDLTNTSNTLKTVYFVVQSKTQCILCVLCLVSFNLV